MKCVSVGRLKILDSRTRMLNMPYRSALLAYMFVEIVAIWFLCCNILFTANFHLENEFVP